MSLLQLKKEFEFLTTTTWYSLDSVFVNIVVTQFNIKRLKPHWH